jgi:hypothetical protein
MLTVEDWKGISRLHFAEVAGHQDDGEGLGVAHNTMGIAYVGVGICETTV